MATKIPLTFKPLTPFIRRAEELDRDLTRPESKLVAFYCRQYAMELGIQLRENDASEEATQFLLSMMENLETEKSKLPHFSQEEGKKICETFAYDIFFKADEEDRAGNANKNTARTFYAAGSFFDILKQFGEVDEEISEKTKYCKWKAADILKAIKEGRKPAPGAPGEVANEETNGVEKQPENDLLSIPQAPTSRPDIHAAPTIQPQPSIPTNSNDMPNLASASITPGQAPANSSNSIQPSYYDIPAAPTAPVTPAAPVYQPPPTSTLNPSASPIPAAGPRRSGTRSKEEIEDALEYAKFAVAALKTKDVNLAIERLELALQRIR